MMTFSPSKRITAEEALSDIWIMKFSMGGRVDSGIVLGSLQHLKEFKIHSTMQKAVMSYMASHLLSSEQEHQAREVFEMLDINHDGQLSRDEILEGYKILLGGNVDQAAREVDAMMMRIDINKNGTIDYNEFLVANIEKADLLNKAKLRQTFDFFDEDKNGQITHDEMKRIFSFSPGDKIIRRIMREADTNHDGQISFDEFIELMKKFIEKKL